jgi:hypothetical protein
MNLNTGDLPSLRSRDGKGVSFSLPPNPFIPEIHPLTGLCRQYYEFKTRVKRPGMSDCSLRIKINIRKQIRFIYYTQVR